MLDADVLSDLGKQRTNSGVAEWFEDARCEHLYVSVLTVGEIRKGATKLRIRGDWRQALTIEHWFAKAIRMFGNRVLPVTVEVAEEWAGQSVHRAGMIVDGLLAATAAVHGLTVVTRNVRNYEHTGVPLLNPFS